MGLQKHYIEFETKISDSTLYNIERRDHTEIQKKYTLAKESNLAWVVNKHNDDLLQAINDWFETYKDSNDLAYMLEKYYGFVQIFDYVDTHKFLNRSKTRLPQYKEFFIDAANKNGISPSLTPEELIRGDVAPLTAGIPDPSGEINTADLVLIQRKVFGLVNF
jgi:hypothetical protein